MVEQIKSIDYASRKVRFVEKAPQPVVNDVLGVLDACLYQNT
jgi:mRNA interferase MazF